MVDSLIGGFELLLSLLRPVVFGAGVFAAVAATVSWGARTRRLSPFSPLARLMRQRVDPWLITPMERRLVRAGGTPAAAPWWMLAVVVLGGLLLLSLLEMVRDELLRLCHLRLDALRSPGGEEEFTHHSRHVSPIRGLVKVQMLK